MHDDKANWWTVAGHYYCGDCQQHFVDWTALLDHLETAFAHVYCKGCDRDFATPLARRTHYSTSSLHAFCTLCDRDWGNAACLVAHQAAAHFPCDGCDWVFETDLARYEHGRQRHSFCIKHRRAFMSDADLCAHLTSSAHQRTDFPFAGPVGYPRFMDDSSALLRSTHEGGG
ncbi:hypothetical protein JCM10207_002971 [Rhodosporidiobolus poonsookiae]